MTETASAALQRFLSDPAVPTWSSFALDRLFSMLPGDTLAKLQRILPEIDDWLSASCHPLTETQKNFVRAVTLKAYEVRPPMVFSVSELSWLLSRFDAVPTPQRALMIALLLPLEDLQVETANSVKFVLVGTPGEQFLV